MKQIIKARRGKCDNRALAKNQWSVDDVPVAWYCTKKNMYVGSCVYYTRGTLYSLPFNLPSFVPTYLPTRIIYFSQSHHFNVGTSVFVRKMKS